MTNEEKSKIQNMLYNWGNTDKIVRILKEEINETRNIINDMGELRAIVYSHVPKSNKVSNTSPVEQSLISSVDLCEKRIKSVTEMIDDYINNKNIVDEAISALDFDKRYILMSKYKKKLTWDQIQVRYPASMSLRNFYRLHTVALEAVNNYLKLLPINEKYS